LTTEVVACTISVFIPTSKVDFTERRRLF